MSHREMRPFIVGIGGTTRPESSTEQALALALRASEEAGARIRLFGGSSLVRLPHYLTPHASDSPEGRELVEALRTADGVILASPGYHGSLSGLVKNAIDYTEEMAGDDRVYLQDIPVGLIATAAGWQGAVSALSALRSIVHALRGWPTPLGVTINSSGGVFEQGRCTDDNVASQLAVVGRQVFDFARNRATLRVSLN